MLAACQVRQNTRLPEAVWPDPQKPALTEAEPPPPIIAGLPPGVLPRSAWTNSQPNMTTARPKPMNGVQRITVHHSAVNSSGMLAKADSVRQLESIRKNHISRTDADGTHWVDIGYHYIIDPSGRVWEGRPIALEGAHVSHTNQHNLGVMMMGNFDEQHPTPEALATLDSFVSSQMRRYRVNIASVFTHQELKPTDCPGRNLQRYMVQTRASSGRMALT